MTSWLHRCALLLCLFCWMSASYASKVDSFALQSKEQLDVLLASGKRTPLDALTPHGKRRLIQSLRWGRRGLGGFDTGPLLQELDAVQFAEALSFLNGDYLTPGLVAKLIGPPIRLPGPSQRLEDEVKRMAQLADGLAGNRSAPISATSNPLAPDLVSHYERTFGSSMSPSSLIHHPVGDLPLLFEAALLASNLDQNSAATEHVQMVHQELIKRGIDTRRKFDDSVLYVLLAAREFDKARAFASGRPHLAGQTIPEVADPLGSSFTGRSVYELDSSGKLLTRQIVQIDAGLVMTVGTGCHFSNDALAAIRNNPDLQARLRREGLMLLISPRAPVPLSYVAEWNRANPTLPIRVPVNVTEWREIADAGTPEFFLYRKNKVVGHLVGWPGGGQMAELLKLLDIPRD
jgi:hypothetical protein